MTKNISILIMTLNEEQCIGKALDSVITLSDDIVVLDSYSSDDTQKVVESYDNVRFIQNEFTDFSSQRNYGLHKISYKNDWVFMLDADEECTKELFSEMLNRISSEKSRTSYIVRRRDYYNKKWIKVHAKVWFERLVKCNKVAFTGTVHEKLSSQQMQGKLFERFNHYPFAKGIPNWIHRHALYAEEMAHLLIKEKIPFNPVHFLSKNSVLKENARKALFQRLPFKFIFYFFYKFIVQKGYLGGIDGIHFVSMETFYQYLVTINVRRIIKNKESVC